MIWLDLFLVTLIQALAWSVAALVVIALVAIVGLLVVMLWPSRRPRP